MDRRARSTRLRAALSWVASVGVVMATLLIGAPTARSATAERAMGAAVSPAFASGDCPPSYSVVDLGDPPGAGSGFSIEGLAINASGQIAVRTGGGKPYVWRRRSFLALDSLPGRPFAVPLAINDGGDVVGMARAAGGNEHAVFWPHDQTTPVELPSLSTAGEGVATGINASRTIVGVADVDEFDGKAVAWVAPGTTSNAFVIQDLGLPAANLSLGTGAAAINAAGDIVGRQVVDAFFRPAGGAPQLFGTDLSPTAINAAQQVVGSGLGGHAFAWAPGTAPVDLGFLFGGGTSEAFAINNSNQIVGRASNGEDGQGAMIHCGGAMRDLNSLIPAGSGWNLGASYVINDAWQIVGMGVHNGQGRHFVLILLS